MILLHEDLHPVLERVRFDFDVLRAYAFRRSQTQQHNDYE
jgi:hypothetical protein